MFTTVLLQKKLRKQQRKLGRNTGDLHGVTHPGTFVEIFFASRGWNIVKRKGRTMFVRR
jgi:hypothetical protein